MATGRVCEEIELRASVYRKSTARPLHVRLWRARPPTIVVRS